jgi:hypothetical protein
MAGLFGLFRGVPQLLEKRRDSAEAQWIEPGNDVTRAILEGSPFELPQAHHTTSTPAVPAYMPETPIAPPVFEPPLPEPVERAAAASQPVTETAQPAAEEQSERPAKRRRWHRAA